MRRYIVQCIQCCCAEKFRLDTMAQCMYFLNLSALEYVLFFQLVLY